MSKPSGKDVLDLAWDRQMTFDFVEPDHYPIEALGQTREGYGLFRRKEAHGGYSYWTDEVPSGVCVFDEGISNPMSLFEALDHLGIGELLWRHIGVSFGYTED